MKGTYRLKHGGLLRCCLLTLDDAMVAAIEPPKEGDTLKCAYCSDADGMVFKGGAWQWAHTPEAIVGRAQATRGRGR